MDCARVDGELVAFQLAALDGATRAAVEAHLTGCARCVSSYLALKRAMDAAEDAGAPSELMRARIRRDVAQELAPRTTASRTIVKARWAIAVTTAVLIAAPLVYRAVRAPQPQVPRVAPADAKSNDTVDTARTTPENLAFL
ncbi:MAG TPA: zf-HC2 domain-containing protein [Polyangia bacterium]|nr:zf-HC2 domain-containing protein [Polyangia bacterium]